MSEHLTDKQRERLLTPCECGHTTNDHGSLVACWRCEDEGGDCETPFEALLTARIEALLAEARAEGARAVVEAVLSAAPRLNAELRHDGTEDPGMAAYIEGFHDAHEAARAAAERIGGDQ